MASKYGLLVCGWAVWRRFSATGLFAHSVPVHPLPIHTRCTHLHIGALALSRSVTTLRVNVLLSFFVCTRTSYHTIDNQSYLGCDKAWRYQSASPGTASGEAVGSESGISEMVRGGIVRIGFTHRAGDPNLMLRSFIFSSWLSIHSTPRLLWLRPWMVQASLRGKEWLQVGDRVGENGRGLITLSCVSGVGVGPGTHRQVNPTRVVPVRHFSTC